MIGFDLAQTFYMDADAVRGAEKVFITSVDLYLHSKPVAGKTKSGIDAPGISVYIGACRENNVPDVSSINQRFGARVEYANLNSNSSSLSATTFTFKSPVPLVTNLSYALLIKFDGSDTDFKIWHNRAGENVYGSETLTNVSSGKIDGSLFVITNGVNLTPERDADLAFKLKIAKFDTTPTLYKFKNQPLELLKIKNLSKPFIGGEKVFQVTAAANGTLNVSAGNVFITGTGTSFNTYLAAGMDFVIQGNTVQGNTVAVVNAITNSTFLSIVTALPFTNTAAFFYRPVIGTINNTDGLTDHIFIANSTANSTSYLASNNGIIGIESGATANIAVVLTQTVNALVPSFKMYTPPGTSISSSVIVADSNGSIDIAKTVSVEMGKRYVFNNYNASFASKSLETSAALPFNSIEGAFTFQTTNPYSTPYVREENLDMFGEKFEINNLSDNEYLGVGNSKARYISKTVTLGAGLQAEDLKVFIRAHRPSGTTIQVYAKIINSNDNEAINLKDWTELVNRNSTTFNSTNVITDRSEFEYALPAYNSGAEQSGVFTTSNGSAVMTGTSGVVNTGIATGDVVRVFSPLFADTWAIDSVTSANTTTITLANPISNSSIVGTGFKVSKITKPSCAFIDVQNSNVATYFSSSRARHATFSSFSIKIVLLSEDGIKIPYVDDLRTVAVSA